MTNRATSPQVDRSSNTARLVEELGEWAIGSGPLYRQLARAITSAIERGALPGAARLPSERAAAEALAVSRGTAVAAYDLLVADGVVERRPGSGSYVTSRGAADYPPGRDGSALVHRLVDRSAASAGVVDLSLSVVADASLLPEITLTTADLRALSPSTGLSPWGLRSLRAQLADRVRRSGLPTGEGQVVVTSGAQQAISLAAACWIRPGDVVVVDDPTYPGAIAAFRQAGARLVGVPMDEQGPRPDALAEALRSRPALLYLQSGVHSPTGVVMTGQRARELAACIAGSRVPFVEDRALAELAWNKTAAAAPVASLLPGTSTVVIGSLSKLYWGGLRIGFARAEEPLALRLARIKATRDLGTSAVSQALAERLLTGSDSVVEALRTRLRTGAGILQAELERWLPDATWRPPDGGMSLWIQLPSPDAGRLAVVARRHGVAVATAESLSPDSVLAVTSDYGLSATSGHRDSLRLSFSGHPEDLSRGARRLGAAWREMTA